jgi:RimJ/RimL family protein N-acetyltransferase
MLRGESVYLRPAERADLPTFVRWMADAETTRNLAVRSPFSLAMEERWFDRVLAEHGKSQFHFVICLLADDRAIGTIGFHHVDYENGGAEFGIAIGEKSEWNKGYGTDALNVICDFGFGELRLERIELDVYAANPRARRAYEKAGFVVEGTQRRAHFLNGEYVDVLRMALLRDEWLALPRRRSWDHTAAT